jgi:hypothetical protein
MTSQDINQGQPDTAYDSYTFGGGHVINTYTPNEEERAAKAAKARAEANSIQADADTKNDERRWSKLKLRASYAAISGLIFGIGYGLGLATGMLR